jgi:hypothetical protein
VHEGTYTMLIEHRRLYESCLQASITKRDHLHVLLARIAIRSLDEDLVIAARCRTCSALVLVLLRDLSAREGCVAGCLVSGR